MADLSTVTLPSGDTYNLKDSNAVPSSEKAAANGVATLDANGLIPQSQVPGMVILSYGNNTWADFLAAYQKNNVIYCRASSNSNPASGSQTRLAFMAYVNNAASPTNVEFQYYRSISSHSATQQGDQVYVYKLDKSAGWTVTVRESYTRVTTNNGLTSTWSNGILTARADMVSTTKLSNAASAATETAGRVYPVALDKNGKLAVNVPWESGSSGSSLQWTIDEDGSGETSLQAVIQNDVTNNIASGTKSHAEGYYTTASGGSSHAEGSYTTASGAISHSEGSQTTASGASSHAEGSVSTASGIFSHAEGLNTIANHRSQHTFGEYNIADASSAGATEKGNYIEVVGNGTSTNARSNARTLDWSGNEVLAGKLTVGSGPTNNMDVATKQYVDANSSSLQWTIDNDGNGSTSLQATVQNDVSNNVASGTFSHAEGTGTTASGNYGSHAEGGNTDAIGNCSHAEGWDTRAEGGDSHAEGHMSHALGSYSHAEGRQTKATHLAQHVFGEWNALDATSAASTQRGNYVEIVGNGTSENARSNARTLDWSGNETLAGSITLGKGTNDEVTCTAAQLKALLNLTGFTPGSY